MRFFVYGRVLVDEKICLWEIVIGIMTGSGRYCCHDAPEHVLTVNPSLMDSNVVVARAL